jgi:hypothetical protein
MALVWRDKHDIYILTKSTNKWYMGHKHKEDRAETVTQYNAKHGNCKEIICSLVELHNSEQLPPPDFTWC